jgi:hypothetical protein
VAHQRAPADAQRLFSHRGGRAVAGDRKEPRGLSDRKMLLLRGGDDRAGDRVLGEGLDRDVVVPPGGDANRFLMCAGFWWR